MRERERVWDRERGSGCPGKGEDVGRGAHVCEGARGGGDGGVETTPMGVYVRGERRELGELEGLPPMGDVWVCTREGEWLAGGWPAVGAMGEGGGWVADEGGSRCGWVCWEREWVEVKGEVTGSWKSRGREGQCV